MADFVHANVVWGCPTCHEDFDDDDYQMCEWCCEIVKPVFKDKFSKYPCLPEDVRYTDLSCADCGSGVLCTGGDSWEDRLFDAWCYICMEDTTIIYADGREAFCCKECRRERAVYEQANSAHAFDGWEPRTARVFVDYCPTCDDVTETGKIDVGGGTQVMCCPECRAEWDDGVDEDDACPFCGEDEDAPEEIDY